MAGLRNLAIGIHRQDGAPISQPPSAAPAATTCGPSPPSDWPDEPGQKITSQRPWRPAPQAPNLKPACRLDGSRGTSESRRDPERFNTDTAPTRCRGGALVPLAPRETSWQVPADFPSGGFPDLTVAERRALMNVPTSGGKA
jgi:hypothetical protein